MSISTTMCKISENVIKTRLEELPEISPNHYGFQKNSATCGLVEAIFRNMEKNAILIDLQKAFDTVGHEVSMEKLIYNTRSSMESY